MSTTKDLKSEDVVRFFLAALSHTGIDYVNRDGLDEGFKSFLEVMREWKEKFFVSRSTQEISELHNGLYHAQVYQLCYWEAPEYRRLFINLTPGHAIQILDEVGAHRERLLVAAQAFRQKYLQVSW